MQLDRTKLPYIHWLCFGPSHYACYSVVYMTSPVQTLFSWPKILNTLSQDRSFTTGILLYINQDFNQE